MWPEAAVFARINTAATATHKFGVGGFMNNAQWSEFSMDSSIFQDTVGRYRPKSLLLTTSNYPVPVLFRPILAYSGGV